jgi:hypothetical protein
MTNILSKDDGTGKVIPIEEVQPMDGAPLIPKGYTTLSDVTTINGPTIETSYDKPT